MNHIGRNPYPVGVPYSSGLPEKANVRGPFGKGNRRYYGLTKKDLGCMTKAERSYRDCDKEEADEQEATPIPV